MPPKKSMLPDRKEKKPEKKTKAISDFSLTLLDISWWASQLNWKFLSTSFFSHYVLELKESKNLQVKRK